MTDQILCSLDFVDIDFILSHLHQNTYIKFSLTVHFPLSSIDVFRKCELQSSISKEKPIPWSSYLITKFDLIFKQSLPRGKAPLMSIGKTMWQKKYGESETNFSSHSLSTHYKVTIIYTHNKYGVCVL